MKKRVFIIHGWEGNPKLHWFPWLKKELEKKGYEVVVPQMPGTMNPTLETWIRHIKKNVGRVDEKTYLVGHSLGCVAILRFLEQLPQDQRLAACVLVAGFGEDLEYEGYKGELSSFFKTSLNWDKIRNSSKKFISLHSEDDPWVNIKNSELFKTKLGAETMVQKNKGHYNEGDGITELPEVFNFLLKI